MHGQASASHLVGNQSHQAKSDNELALKFPFVNNKASQESELQEVNGSKRGKKKKIVPLTNPRVGKKTVVPICCLIIYIK